MENSTLPVSANCIMSYEEYHLLWLLGIVVISATSTLVAMIAERLRKRVLSRRDFGCPPGINTAADPEYK